MSTQPSPPPRQSQVTHSEEASLPSGQCRYILLNPEIKGLRCACVGFSLTRSLPGVTCDCGHLSCYHVKTAEPVTDKHEVELLRRRVLHLEEQLDRERQGDMGSVLGSVIRRLGELEELVDKSREDMTQEIKGSYGNLTQLWNLVEQAGQRQAAYESRLEHYDERLDGHEDDLQRLKDRHMELDEASMTVEERVEKLECARDRPASRGHWRRNSTSEPTPRSLLASTAKHFRRVSGEKHDTEAIKFLTPTITNMSRPGTGQPPSRREAWTVHVSLLPTASQPFPFEKDTDAYKRCLSRGLHQMVAINGHDSEAFVSAVSNAFASVLKGRRWMPLQAKLCDALQLEGLPMLRPLDAACDESDYDAEFLRKHCAVCGLNGKIESLYIAMRSETLSWHFLRHSPPSLEGLESCWDYDPILDHNDAFNDESVDDSTRPSAGDIVPSLPTVKRTASELSRTSSFGSAATGETEGSRPKIQKTNYIPVPLELCRRVETV